MPQDALVSEKRPHHFNQENSNLGCEIIVDNFL